jgi:chemosensory pili system protein ChpA (sensor histidine kinase/response regulator)
MVGIDGLSQIAGCMETALEKIQEGELAFSAEAFAALESTVDRFELFCQSLRQESVIDEALLVIQTKEAFARIGPGNGEKRGRVGASMLFGGEEIALSDSLLSPPEEELLGVFRVEAEEHLEALQLAVQSLQSQVADKRRLDGHLLETIGKIRRCVHTVKGASAVFGLHDLAAFGHLIADVLDWLCTSATTVDPHLVEQLAEAIDLLVVMISAPEHFDEQRAERVLAGLQVRMESFSGEEACQSGPVPDALVSGATGARHEDVAVGTESGSGDSGSLKGSMFSEEEQQLLREGFQEEADEHLQQVHQAMQLLEKTIVAETELTQAHREEIRKIRRSVHTIKGASAVIGLGPIASYAHGVEDFLDWLYDGARQLDPAMVNDLAESLDVLGLLVVQPDSVAMDRQEQLHRRLQSLTQRADLSSLVEPELQLTQEAVTPYKEAIVEEPLEAAGNLPAAAESAKTIRINQQQLDGLINLANELLVGVSGFDQNMGLFKSALADLELTTRRLKGIALELETKFEVKALDRLAQHFDHLDKSVASLKQQQSFSEFDALELDRYTQLNLIIRSLNEAAIDVSALHANLGGIYSGIGGDINRQHRVIRELQVQMMRTRMSPMSSLAVRLSRTMRDVAARLGKRVRLVVEGERVELDRMVWEKLADPFMHLVRNAIHHGIEPEAERLAAGKPAIATITLAGRREGNSMVICFSDDGQ